MKKLILSIIAIISTMSPMVANAFHKKAEKKNNESFKSGNDTINDRDSMDRDSMEIKHFRVEKEMRKKPKKALLLHFRKIKHSGSKLQHKEHHKRYRIRHSHTSHTSHHSHYSHYSAR